MSDLELDVRLLPVCEVAEEPLTWLWPGRLAFGKLALLEGDPGLGKSLVTLDLCARLSRGHPLPDGGPGPEPCNSLVLNAEDGAGDTVRARLVRLGADLQRVFVMERKGLSAQAVWLPSQMGLLETALTRSQARLLVIDPLLAFLDSNVTPGNDQSIRRALGPLGRLAAKHSCVPLLARHLNKGGARQAIYRGGGSIGLAGACRSVWLAARDPIEKGRCVLAEVKNNLGPPQPSLAYRVLSDGLGPPTLRWEGHCPLSADLILGGSLRGTRALA